MVDEDYARSVIKTRLEDLKAEHFGHWPEPVILHRKDIVNKLGPFEILRNPVYEQRFNDAILALFKSLDFHVITVMIDKHAHREKYKIWWVHPYHYCMEVIIEKYAQWLIRQGGKGDVAAEARTPKMDKKLKKAFRYFYRNGTKYVEKAEMQSLLTSSELKLYRKKDDIAALQLADLIAHPSAAYTKARQNNEGLPQTFGARIAEILVYNKYDRSYWGKIYGYGTKWLP